MCQPSRRQGFESWVRKIPRRRKWQPTTVFLLGKSYGQRSLVGYGSWGGKKSDMTKCYPRKEGSGSLIDSGGCWGRENSVILQGSCNFMQQVSECQEIIFGRIFSSISHLLYNPQSFQTSRLSVSLRVP